MPGAESEPTCAICQEPHIAPPLRLKSNEALVAGAYVLLGKYTITGKIGDESGMGSVFQATHKQIGRTVAIKRMNPEFSACPLMVEKFANEARIVAEIQHPNICDVLDAGFDRSLGHYIVMEWLAGGSLRSLLKLLGRVPPRQAIALVRQLLAGVEATHRARVVHRDIKPENVFVATRQPWEPGLDLGLASIKLLDFGIARVARSPGAMTMQGPMTILYGAPEQALRPMSVGPPADLWAVALVLHELVTGELPFHDQRPGVAPWQVVLANEQGNGPATPLTPIDRRIPGAPAELTEIVQRCLAFDPARRYLSAAELSQALLPLESAASPIVDPPTLAPPLQRIPETTSAASIADLADRVRPPPRPAPPPRSPRVAAMFLIVVTAISIAWILATLTAPTPIDRKPIAAPATNPTPPPPPPIVTPPITPPVEPAVVDLPPGDAPRKKPRRPPGKSNPGEIPTLTFDDERARQQVESQVRPAADACFKKHPFLDVFEYEVTLTVAPDGQTRATGTTTSPLRRCLLEIFSPGFTLGATQDGGTLTYTFHSPG